MTLTRQILDFWFGAPGMEGYGANRKIWFEADAAFDEDVRRRFAVDLDRAADGAHDAMAAGSAGALALTVLLDQFPRNIHRGTPQAFAFDGKALATARRAIDAGYDAALPAFQRPFFYLPLEHSENLADQERSVALFRAHGDANALDFAIRHRDVIARFGRFPHRNAILRRDPTPEEVAFLQQPGASFGGQTPRGG
jgi:uncharacterized protein (DUF924 family)